jgi:hypothetical protein
MDIYKKQQGVTPIAGTNYTIKTSDGENLSKESVLEKLASGEIKIDLGGLDTNWSLTEGGNQ